MVGSNSGAAERIRLALREAARGLVDREALLESIVLAAIAGEHVLVVGPPGTAKSEAARRISTLVQGRYFEYLLGRFTEPAEIFGPIDLRRLREGVVETNTAGMLPEAEIVFLDEVFRGSTAILNSLLSLLNERKFHAGTRVIDCPLRVCVGATNQIPDDESLAAFADRFLIQIHVEPVSDTLLERLLEAGASSGVGAGSRAGAGASVADLDALREAAGRVELGRVRPHLADAVRTLRNHGVPLSDRRIVKIQRLVAAAAALEGREQATRADLWPLIHAIPGADRQLQARDLLRDQLDATQSDGLPAAAELASSGPQVRAARLLASGDELLAAEPSPTITLRLESIAREIDASFAPDHRPAGIAELRQAIVERVRTSGEG